MAPSVQTSAAFLLGLAAPHAVLCYAPSPGSQPPRVTTSSSSKPSQTVLAQASELVSQASASSQNLIASLFEFEHARAARFERIGVHEYWNDPRIHNFGNTGLRGLLHALVVPIATHAIDRFAYMGVDARKLLHEVEFPADATVVDLCAGVGFSSARNGHVTCVDTSAQMLAVARLRRPDIKHFETGNAETWGEVRGECLWPVRACACTRRRLRAPCVAPLTAVPLSTSRAQSESFDIATLMFGTHEMPAHARRRVVRNALRLARRKVMIVDIWPGFEPNAMMLSGEPFVLDYLANIDDDIDASYDPMVWSLERVDVVEGHVRMWKFEKLEWGI